MEDSLKMCCCGVALGILMILVLCIGGLIVLAVLAPEPEEPVSFFAREKALALGGWATMEGVTVSVTDYEFASSYEDEYMGQVIPEERAKFLWIHVYAENAGEVEKGLPDAWFFMLLYTRMRYTATPLGLSSGAKCTRPGASIQA